MTPLWCRTPSCFIFTLKSLAETLQRLSNSTSNLQQTTVPYFTDYKSLRSISPTLTKYVIR